MPRAAHDCAGTGRSVRSNPRFPLQPTPPALALRPGRRLATAKRFLRSRCATVVLSRAYYLGSADFADSLQQPSIVLCRTWPSCRSNGRPFPHSSNKAPRDIIVNHVPWVLFTFDGTELDLQLRAAEASVLLVIGGHSPPTVFESTARQAWGNMGNAVIFAETLSSV